MQIQRIPLVMLTLAMGLIAVDSASAQRRYLDVKDPAEFRIGDPVYSGPQPGEQLRGFPVTRRTRSGRDEDFDPVALAAGKPHFLMFVDDMDLGEDISAWAKVREIHQNSRTGLAATAVILGHERATGSFFNLLSTMFQIGYAPEGRDGPGAYGLDRNIRMTILITDAKGKVLYNFPFRQPPVDFPDPAVMGALAEVVGEDRETVEAWINEEWLNETTRRPKMPRDFFAHRTPETAKKIIDYMDRNGDGKVSKDEAPEGLKPHFDKVDTNKDGGIDVKEAEMMPVLFRIVRVIGRSNQRKETTRRPKTPRVTAKKIIDYMDRNGDGKVSKDEAPGGLKPHLNEFDTNKDGGIDVKEAEVMPVLAGIVRVIGRANQRNAKSTRKASESKKQ
jgi:Ca2+-binding EF-hand superfamily protein